MKRRLLIPLVVFLLIAGVGSAVHFRPRTVPWDECSELYRHYADSQDINAAYIKNYKVNDTLTLSATILEATNDTGWTILLNDFHLPLPEQAAYDKILANNDDVLSVMEVDNTDDEAVASHRDKYICVFHIEDSVMKTYVQDALFNLVINSITNQQDFYEHE